MPTKTKQDANSLRQKNVKRQLRGSAARTVGYSAATAADVKLAAAGLGMGLGAAKTFGAYAGSWLPYSTLAMNMMGAAGFSPTVAGMATMLPGATILGLGALGAVGGAAFARRAIINAGRAGGAAGYTLGNIRALRSGGRGVSDASSLRWRFRNIRSLGSLPLGGNSSVTPSSVARTGARAIARRRASAR